MEYRYDYTESIISLVNMQMMGCQYKCHIVKTDQDQNVPLFKGLKSHQCAKTSLAKTVHFHAVSIKIYYFVAKASQHLDEYV